MAKSAQTANRIADYAHDMFRSAKLALQKSSTITRTLLVADRSIRIFINSKKLETLLLRAFAHPHLSKRIQPDLTILACDFGLANVEYPKPPWNADWNSEQTKTHQRPMLCFEDECYIGLYEPYSGLLSLLNTHTNLAVWCLPNISKLPLYELSAPFRSIFHWWMRKSGLQILHAGAVANEKVAVLCIGRSGVGKSSTILATRERGLQYLGDDYVLVEATDKPIAWSIYRTAKLYKADLELFPRLADVVRHNYTAENGKNIIFLDKACCPPLKAGFRVGAILVPLQTNNAQTRWKKISAPEALRALAPSTMLQLRGADRHDLKNIGHIISHVPCYHLELGNDRNKVQQTVCQLLETL